ncbi:TetR family transcriptional regulator [Planococcus antarcticus DSM 14505]|uniref:TetR family transcriptional regulator n=1 Tax=Planococcus antarcticus DSM 14505 TaxID=1185653 RepID=A0A1C7DHN2_9BACL|nr:TetR/AcrR family transcriptional regulator [Planococcus antarcticus]ANU10944.1 TetR family transcriptional regulator [Planococcus antarcticus DSM 14505]EIM05036.1 TetR family transcriptional regulator [Planococcus antarcticus DSM 14505]
MRKISLKERQIMRRSYAEKIMETVSTEGFITLTIQDLACLMGISRASLYNFFASKEDIILEVTEIYIDYLKKTNQFINNSRFSYVQRLPTVFEQSAFSAVYASEIYLSELRSVYPAFYDRKLKLANERIAILHTFYENGIIDGDFNPLHPALIVAQDEAALRKILNSSFLTDVGLSLEDGMYGYYEIMKHRTFTPASMKRGQDPYIKNVVEVIVSQLKKK